MSGTGIFYIYIIVNINQHTYMLNMGDLTKSSEGI